MSVLLYGYYIHRQAAVATVMKSYKEWEVKDVSFYGTWTVRIGKSNSDKTYNIFVSFDGTQIIGEPGCMCDD